MPGAIMKDSKRRKVKPCPSDWNPSKRDLIEPPGASPSSRGSPESLFGPSYYKTDSFSPCLQIVFLPVCREGRKGGGE